MTDKNQPIDVVIVGSGFGGTVAALSLARKFKERGKGETILVLERGTWWTTPVGTVQDKEVKTYQFLKERNQPVQFWSSVEHFKGFIDIITRCVRRTKNEDGLYDLTHFGTTGPFGLPFGGQSDGVTILRACGVGGGSLIYANVTIRPPDFVFEDLRWPIIWDDKTRNDYFERARHAIGYGVVSAQQEWEVRNIPYQGTTLPKGSVNTGLSNIVTRSARLNPHWQEKLDQNNSRGIKQINPKNPADPSNALWIDRARVFQTAMSQLTHDYGTVDSSINDINPEPGPFDPSGSPKNYCERQGRCIVGCLPGARHTLNKQLMAAVLGTPKGDPPLFPEMKLEPLAEVDVIKSRAEGGYEIHFFKRDQKKPWHKTLSVVAADKVILAAGCVGTNEIMLRSKERGTLPNLSDKVGFGFSTNGDYLAFLEGTKEQISLTRGPITTSFAHFNTQEAVLDGNQSIDTSKFHTIEDNGIPRALSSLVGVGVPLLRTLANGRRRSIFISWKFIWWALKRPFQILGSVFRNYSERQEIFKSEDEYTANMMCIAGMGREAAVGQFRLGRSQKESALRVRRVDGREFYQDPIYQEIRGTLDKFAKTLTCDKNRTFINPFLSSAADALEAKSISLTHPLGGCRMAKSPSEGVVDEYGRVFDKTKVGERPFYEGLYIADAAIIPTALGVNPSLTISALALRIADKIIGELR